MSNVEVVVMVVGMFVVTFATRYPLLVLAGRVQLPGRVFAALKYVPVAVLMAISVPIITAGDSDERVYLAIDNAHLVGGITSIVVAATTKKLLPTIIIGMAVFLVWQALF